MTLACPIIDRLLDDVYGAQLQRRVVIRSLAMECMLGHMATQRVHSIEAGIVLIADGCDMECGRARIPMLLSTTVGFFQIEEVLFKKIERSTIKQYVELYAGVSPAQMKCYL